MKKIIFLFLITHLLFSVNRVKLFSVEEIKKPKNFVFDRITYDINGLSFENEIVQYKKENFINFILPSIYLVKEEISKEKKKISELLYKENLSSKDKKYLTKLFEKYKVDKENKAELLKRLNTVPVELALAQAIIESGWGTSRFSREGNNIYGIWSFDKSEKRIKSYDGIRDGKAVYLRKYEYIYECVEDYFYSLSVGFNYEGLRDKLLETEDYLELSKTLKGYSEIGEEYIERLNNIITYNELTKYRDYKLSE